MLVSTKRDDVVFVKINTEHITYMYPENGQAGGHAIIVLSSGDKVKLAVSMSEFSDTLDHKSMIGE